MSIETPSPGQAMPRMLSGVRAVRVVAGPAVVAERARWCDSFLPKLRGLMFRRSLAADEALVLVEGSDSRMGTSIHMFFVFFPIAAIWIDSAGLVVDARLARPFAPSYVPHRPARYVLEGPPALLDRVHIGDRVEFQPVA